MLTGNLVRLALACAALCVATGVIAAPADDIKDASKLYQQGKLDAALAKVNAALVQQPKDAQGRFLKGLIFTEQKKITDAIQIFNGLTEDYPELPEPYNNLAVLYASLGNYDKAKAALELAIHTHPSYATAHENLGDIYAQLARRAYDKALQLDKTNTTAQSKLAMIKDLFSSPKATASEPAKAVPTVVAKADPPKVTPATTPSAKVESRPAVESKPAVAATTVPATTGGNADAAVTSTLESWAKAWAARDVAAYLAFYAPDFQVPDGLTRAAWEAQRKARIEAAAKITVSVSNVKVTISGNQATAVFRQSYKSDKLTSRNTKTVKLVRSGDKWLIQAEHAKG
ncbi:MAG: tetratricopeptide repeat protein [Betaproteobacteria bacterium]|nr:tetratricopeptide repeat protein [Betaproteobacteria bacterium]